ETLVAQRVQYPGEVDLTGDASVPNPAGDVLERTALEFVHPGLSFDDIDTRPMDAGIARQADAHEDLAMRGVLDATPVFAGRQPDGDGDMGRPVGEPGLVPPDGQAADGPERLGAGDRLCEECSLHCFGSLRELNDNLERIHRTVIGTIQYD